MRKIGFIGYGAMGSIMLRALLDSGALSQNQVIVFNRTPEKLKDFRKKYRRVEVAKSLAVLAPKCERIFICTATSAVKEVLNAIQPYLPEDIHIISITGTIEIKCLENIFSGSITKIIPTQIAEVGEGVTLVCHNKRVLAKDKKFIRDIFASLGRVKELKESQLDLAADLSSCAPAFHAAILNNFAEMAKKHGKLTPEEINEIVIPTAYGTMKLLLEQNISFTGLINRVATPGGITEEGVKVLNQELPRVFDKILTVTLAKRASVKKRMRRQYGLDSETEACITSTT
jgi:pyrroline-5-carboxylate reductase